MSATIIKHMKIKKLFKCFRIDAKIESVMLRYKRKQLYKKHRLNMFEQTKSLFTNFKRCIF